MQVSVQVDPLVETALRSLAGDEYVSNWPRAKEHNWVNYFVFRHLLPKGVIDPAQIAIEMPVAQPKGKEFTYRGKVYTYKTKTTRRDVVIWRTAGGIAWDANGNPTSHPLAILEWTVHRRGYPKPTSRVFFERQWLKDYRDWRCSEGDDVACYAVEIDGQENPTIIKCFRVHEPTGDKPWLSLPCKPTK